MYFLLWRYLGAFVDIFGSPESIVTPVHVRAELHLAAQPLHVRLVDHELRPAPAPARFPQQKSPDQKLILILIRTSQKTFLKTCL